MSGDYGSTGCDQETPAPTEADETRQQPKKSRCVRVYLRLHEPGMQICANRNLHSYARTCMDVHICKKMLLSLCFM